MSSRVLYTPEEDMKIWRFAMEQHEGSSSYSIWEQFKTKVATDRSPNTLNFRFKNILIPHLINTKFHTETKLRLMNVFRIPLDQELYNQLTKEADIELDSEAVIVRYRIHPNVLPNSDHELSDPEFIERMVPIIPKQNRFTPEEDEEIWNYMAANYEKYTKGSETFWRRLIHQTNSIRGPNVYLQRFNKALLPQLHKAKLPIETKLKIYKKLKCPVDKEFLKILHSHADLQVDQFGVITDYEMFQNGNQKRKMEKEVAATIVKKPRVSDAPEASPEVVVLKNPKEEVYFEQEGRTEDENYLNFGYEEPEDLPHQNQEHHGAQEHLQMNYGEDLHFQNRYHHGVAAEPAGPDQERVITEIDKMKGELDQKLDGLARSMRKSLDRKISEIARSLNSMHHGMKGEMKTIRKELKNGLQDQSSGPSRNMREYLLNLKKLVSSLDSPDMESVEQRIDSALLNYPEGDETQLPIRVLKSAFDAGLTMIGH